MPRAGGRARSRRLRSGIAPASRLPEAPLRDEAALRREWELEGPAKFELVCAAGRFGDDGTRGFLVDAYVEQETGDPDERTSERGGLAILSADLSRSLMLSELTDMGWFQREALHNTWSAYDLDHDGRDEAIAVEHGDRHGELTDALVVYGIAEDGIEELGRIELAYDNAPAIDPDDPDGTGPLACDSTWRFVPHGGVDAVEVVTTYSEGVPWVDDEGTTGPCPGAGTHLFVLGDGGFAE